ncbi:MAG: RDD family protein [Alphaproteobacteria bacterium]|nr:RDD family protein [Alphaproteobacteria bacterium]
MATADKSANMRAGPADAARREIVTPEGVAIPVRLADRGTRAAAVLIDLSFIGLGIVSIALLFYFLFVRVLSPGWVQSFVLLVSFAIRSFYFIFFELRWQGATPGKRFLGLRVIDRAGGRLRPDAVFARNLMREIELFMPISLLAAAERVGPEAYVIVLSLIWIGILTLLPFFNRDRLRAGDIIAGTWVVEAPKAMLLQDIAGAGASPSVKQASEPRYRFTQEQLAVYGIYELQTLEEVLRQHGPTAAETQQEVAKRIQRKIGWGGDRPAHEARRFLEDFYTALRAHLEARMLLGQRREDKHDRDGVPPNTNGT